ncbi:MAG: hypothetical protein R3F43_01015 [bacterium]
MSGADAKLTSNASQVALMRKGQRTHLHVERLPGPPGEDFAGGAGAGRSPEGDGQDPPPRRLRRSTSSRPPASMEYWEQDPCWVEPPIPIARRGSRL